MHTAERSNGYENKEPRMHMDRGKDEERKPADTVYHHGCIRGSSLRGYDYGQKFVPGESAAVPGIGEKDSEYELLQSAATAQKERKNCRNHEGRCYQP